MYSILTLNKIAACGTDKFSSEYVYGEDIKNPTAIMVRSASMHEMDLSPETIAVARAGAGTNNVPVEAYAQKGVVVFNTPGANANAVKELVICGILMSSRKIGASMDWCKSLKGEGEAVGKLVEKGKSNFAGPEIGGKTLGVIGLGAIGFKVAKAAAALEMRIIGYDPFLSDSTREELPEGTKVVDDINEVFKNSDYISLHLPLNDATKNTVNKETLALCKDGVRFLNFARAGLVNSDAIIQALNSGKCAAYVVDFPSDEIIGVQGVTAFPHLGASTPESEDNCAIMAADELIAYIERGEIKNSVNLPNLTGLGEVEDKRVCVICQSSAVDAVKAALGAQAKSAVKNGYGYVVADGACECTLKGIDGIIKARTISK